MKNTFYFSLKNLSFLRNLNICPNFFVHLGKSLDKKMVDFEIMNLKSEKQTVAIHILSNISKRKGNITWEIFLSKTMQIEKQGDYFRFLKKIKKAMSQGKASGQQLNFNILR